MNCPRCKTPLKTKILECVEVDECQNCKGIWFDKGELRQTKDNFDSDLNWMDFEIGPQTEFKAQEDPISCPHCGKKMVLVNYDKTDVEIDYCQYCNGVWLDQGEFGKIIFALEQQLTTMSTGDYFKAALKEAGDLLRSKEGFLSDWRDLTNVLRLMTYRGFVENPRVKRGVEVIQNTPIK